MENHNVQSFVTETKYKKKKNEKRTVHNDNKRIHDVKP